MSVILAAQNLKKSFLSREGKVVKAVDGVSFELRSGETLGLVGESGCGKTTVARLLLNLIKPDGGSILYRGGDVLKFTRRQLKQFYQKAQIVFQDPYSSLNPRMRIGEIIAEPLVVHDVAKGRESQKKVKSLLKEVGLDENAVYRLPHQFSGGQRQRIAIARALTLNPEILICDEPVSALDLSIQARILNLLLELQERHRLSILFISHDLAVVRRMSDRIINMSQGRLTNL